LWYLLRLLVHSWFHYSLEYFVICLSFEWSIHESLNTETICMTMACRLSLPVIDKVSRHVIPFLSDSIKFFSLLLSFLINQTVISMLTSFIPTLIMKGT